MAAADAAETPVAQEAPPSPSGKTTEPLTGEALTEAVKKQVEYYFSRSNLANDAYLVSQMDAQMFVPLDIIIGFKGVQKLTLDLDLILEAISTSTDLVIDKNGAFTKIRPNVTSERSTLILREIPQATPEDEVKALFGEYAKDIDSIKSEIGDNWYVRFTGEKPALAAHEHLAAQTFNGSSIRARIKTESVLRSFMGDSPPAQFGKGGGGKGKGGGSYKGGYKGGYYNAPPQMQGPAGGMYYSDDINPQAGRNPYAGAMQQYGQQGYYAGGKGVAPPGGMGVPGAQGTGKKKKNKKGRGEAVIGIGPKVPTQPPNFSMTDDFPSLPPSPIADKKTGYEGEYKAYSMGEIAEICNKLGPEADGAVPRPDSLPEDSPYVSKASNASFEVSFADAVAAN